MNNVRALFENISLALETTFPNETLRHQTVWWLLQALTDKEESALIAHENTFSLTADQKQKLEHWLHDLVVNKKPLQYVLGFVPFDDLTISVEPPILIPRPETEEWIIALADALKQLQNQKIAILDIGAGTGCIALTLAKALPAATIYATDIEPQALELAQRNAQQNNISNVQFLESDMFEKIPNHILFDLIVSNPPYIAQDEWETLDASVKIWETPTALIASEYGLYFIKKIINEAPAHIKQNRDMLQLHLPQLVLEIGYQQGPQAELCMHHAGYNDVQLQKDLFGNDRVISGRIDHVAHTPKT